MFPLDNQKQGTLFDYVLVKWISRQIENYWMTNGPAQIDYIKRLLLYLQNHNFGLKSNFAFAVLLIFGFVTSQGNKYQDSK